MTYDELTDYCKKVSDEIIRQDEQIRQLKKQVEEYQKELEKADNLTQICIFKGKEESKISYRKCLNILDKKETQQKEFIDYLENEIQQKREKSTALTAFIRNVVPLQQCLQKYKEIIGDNK